MENGKGDKDTRTPNFKLRRENYDRIFGKKDQPTPETKEPEIKDEKAESIPSN